MKGVLRNGYRHVGWQRLTVQESGVAADHEKHAREDGGQCEGCVKKRVPTRGGGSGRTWEGSVEKAKGARQR